MSDQEKDSPKSTTVVSVEATDGVVICADRQVTGRRVTEIDKLKKIHPQAVIGTAGHVTDIQTMLKDINKGVEEYRMRRSREMTIDALFEYVREQVNPGAGIAYPEYLSNVILAGFDGEPQAAELDYTGTKIVDQGYVTVGSGGSVARGVISEGYEDNLDIEEAEELAVRAMEVAADEGAYTGIGLDVAVIDENGVHMDRSRSM